MDIAYHEGEFVIFKDFWDLVLYELNRVNILYVYRIQATHGFYILDPPFGGQKCLFKEIFF